MKTGDGRRLRELVLEKLAEGGQPLSEDQASRIYAVVIDLNCGMKDKDPSTKVACYKGNSTTAFLLSQDQVRAFKILQIL